MPPPKDAGKHRPSWTSADPGASPCSTALAKLREATLTLGTSHLSRRGVEKVRIIEESRLMTLVKDMVERKLRAARPTGDEKSLPAEPLRASHHVPEMCLRAIEARVEKLSRGLRGVTFSLAKLDLAPQCEADAVTDGTRRELLREMFRPYLSR